MIIEQLSVFLENRSGRLHEVFEILAKPKLTYLPVVWLIPPNLGFFG